MRPLQAHCHRGLGALYAETGRQEQARAALATAIELYRAMEMTFWLPCTYSTAWTAPKKERISTSYSDSRMPRIQTPVVAVSARTPNFFPSRSLGPLMPEATLQTTER